MKMPFDFAQPVPVPELLESGVRIEPSPAAFVGTSLWDSWMSILPICPLQRFERKLRRKVIVPVKESWRGSAVCCLRGRNRESLNPSLNFELEGCFPFSDS
jgi:hypothetical protein